MLSGRNSASKIKEKMDKAAERIGRLPYSGTKVPDEKISKMGLRMVIVEKYLMFYRIFESERKVIFYHVLNGKMNYPTLLSRLYSEYTN